MTSKCQHYLQSLSEYVDGTLSEELCRELESHMAECENCRIVVNTLTKTVSLYHQLPSPEMPSDVRERLYKVLDIQSLYGGSRDDQEDRPAS
jgi:anti-sigma factor RsiW